MDHYPADSSAISPTAFLLNPDIRIITYVALVGYVVSRHTTLHVPSPSSFSIIMQFKHHNANNAHQNWNNIAMAAELSND